MSHRIDELNERILYYFGLDARDISTSDIAEEMEVTPATIRNRIEQLEEQWILRGYSTDIDYWPTLNLSRLKYLSETLSTEEQSYRPFGYLPSICQERRAECRG